MKKIMPLPQLIAVLVVGVCGSLICRAEGIGLIGTFFLCGLGGVVVSVVYNLDI